MNKNMKFQMKKTQILNRCLLALLAPTLICCTGNLASAASIGTPSYTSTPVASPQTNDLTHLGLYNDLDWQIYSGTGGPNQAGNNPVTIVYRKAGGSSITNLGMYFGGSIVINDPTGNRSATKFTWSDGAAPNTSSTAIQP